MEKAFYLFAVCLFDYIRSGISTSFETVWLKDVTTRFQTDKRTLIDLDLPNDLTFHLIRGSEILTINLKRNNDINPNADVYFARQLKDGRPVLVKSRNYEKEDVAYYQDMENSAYMTVRCVKKSDEPCERIINGNIRIGDRSYDVQPVETDVTSRNLVEDLGGLGKQYILKDQAHMQRGYSVQNKDKSRNLKKVYNVKVAAIIDSSAWDFYLSTVSKLNILTRTKTVKRKIQQIYSHIFNGIHLLYQGIEDPEISINVILARFIIFKIKTEFPYKEARPFDYNNTMYVEALDYIQDIQTWDQSKGAKYEPAYDHGMLFTKYTLYQGIFTRYLRGNNSLSGLTHRGMVCTVGLRNSVIMIDDLSSLVTAAAHELGHSLGAFHDGEGDASDCKAEDEFIMSAIRVHPVPGQPYSKNQWLFSRCSVRSFKQNLMDKACLTIEGNYYDDQEYAHHVMQQTGEEFIADKQCQLIHGQRSIVCETPIGNICHLMRCTDPKRRICGKTYYFAARGTDCGAHKWCIDGRCVFR